jgi:hypothetical protein
MAPYEAVMRKMALVALLIAIAAMLAPRAASAQAAAGQPPPVLRGGEEVFVVHAGSGQELRGRLVELSSSSLAMLVDGRRVEIPIDDVLRIDGRKDSLKNGTLIGMAIFGGLAVATCPGLESAGWCVYGIALNTGLGAAIGAGIDALHKGRSPIYVKPAKSGAALQVRMKF